MTKSPMKKGKKELGNDHIEEPKSVASNMTTSVDRNNEMLTPFVRKTIDCQNYGQSTRSFQYNIYN